MRQKITRSWILGGNHKKHPLLRLADASVVNKESGCWELKSNLDRCGYGRFKIRGRQLGAHKISYILHHGDYDQDNLEILHSCDNPSCINPEHLSVGTHAQNILDSISRGRHISRTGFTKDNNYRINIGDKFCGGLIFIQTARRSASLSNERFYVGSACKKHPHNAIRKTSNGGCVSCRAESDRMLVTSKRRPTCPYMRDLPVTGLV